LIAVAIRGVLDALTLVSPFAAGTGVANGFTLSVDAERVYDGASRLAGTMAVVLRSKRRFRIKLVGAAAEEFFQSNSCGTSVAAGGSCAITVWFVPTFASNVAARVSIATDGGGGSQYVTVGGKGVFR
jgi:hypothetical protein